MIIFFFLLNLGLLTIYSYSQIELNLTLSSNYYYQTIQNQLINLGYYNRPLSALIYLLIIIFLFLSYILFLRQAYNNQLSKKKIQKLIFTGLMITIFSYPAFSHDIFNYMFDARIVTKYYQNPYFHTALEFSYDLWTRFMHWTHRYYPYGPVWLFITLPFSFLGLGKFVPTLFLFKVLFIFFHLGNTYLVYKITQRENPKHALFSVVFYAFNPLILIESIVSPHNESVMLFFLLLAIYYSYIKKKNIFTYVSLIFSIGIKYATVVSVPVFIFSRYIYKRFQFDQIINLLLFFLLFPLFILVVFREPYPWYFITFIGIVSLFGRFQFLHLLIICQSLGALLRYVPFLYFGEYGKTVSLLQNIFYIIPTIILIICVIIFKFNKDHLNKGML